MGSPLLAPGPETFADFDKTRRGPTSSPGPSGAAPLAESRAAVATGPVPASTQRFQMFDAKDGDGTIIAQRLLSGNFPATHASAKLDCRHG